MQNLGETSHIKVCYPTRVGHPGTVLNGRFYDNNCDDGQSMCSPWTPPPISAPCAVEDVIRISEINIGSNDHIIIQNTGPNSCTVDVAGLEVKYVTWSSGQYGEGTLASAQLAGGETLALFERGARCPSGLSAANSRGRGQRSRLKNRSAV